MIEVDDEEYERALSIHNPKLYWNECVRPLIIHDIDSEMINIIDDLNNSGQLTDECCAGHSINECGNIFFMRKNPNNRAILNILRKHNLKNIKRKTFFYDCFGTNVVYYEFDAIGIK